MKSIAALFIALVSFSPAVPAQDINKNFGEIMEFKTSPLTHGIIEHLRKGGYVLYMRHGNTDTSHPDAINVDLNDCATQRPLSDEGRRIVARIGNTLRNAKIPVGDLYSSPMCRAKETALITFKKNATVNNLLRYTANMEDKEKYQALDTLRKLISAPVQGHTNRVIVAHSLNMMGLIGYLPAPEGTIVIFKPKGNRQFDYIASVAPKQWEEFLH